MVPPFVFLWMATWFITPLFRKLAGKALPWAAGNLRLDYVPSRSYRKVGFIKGVFREHMVMVTPDDQARIRVYYNISLPGKLELTTAYKPHSRPDENEKDFTTSHPFFNFIFKTKRAGTRIAPLLAGSDPIINGMAGFYGKWITRLQYMTIAADAIIVSFKYGDPFNPYIPERVLVKCVPELVDLVSQLEGVLKGIGTPKDRQDLERLVGFCPD
jgi:hypothetical protein